jgi:hypothetical protein
MHSLCIHGHFYQPPREDPISDIIPDETGAEPYPNWNSRILAECYRPNALAGNFEKISFNIGPTLFRWLEKKDPDTANRVIQQESQNFTKYGVGNGMAQGYNHVILPLASHRDKVTQIVWGVADFVYHFGHQPSGFWLPEAAVDIETLSVLSDCGLEFTILAPWQADAEVVDTAHPYLVDLPGGRKPFTVFFYDRGLSTSVSFQPASTVNGDDFLERVKQNQNGSKSDVTLVASDGELYGHHQPYRDLFLTYILNQGAYSNNIDLTYPGLWMRKNPASETVKIHDRTSWSCHHGVARWGDGCECTPNPAWKAHFRLALNQLAESLDKVYEAYLSQYTDKCWEIRDAYVQVLGGRTDHETLISSFVDQKLSKKEYLKISQLLDAQYERQRMFTSCGLYFEDFHRIEPQNNVAYAAMAVWLTKIATGVSLEENALQLFRPVRSQRSGLRADTVFSQTWIRANDLIEELMD